MNFQTVQRYIRKKLQSDDGYITKRLGVMPVSSLDPYNERAEEIKSYQQPQLMPQQSFAPRRLTISFEI